ncbi:MAG: cupin domain-containing protein [Bdellovibrio sp.]|nr:cupin domain-containing protein [Methylotenera sp.]
MSPNNNQSLALLNNLTPTQFLAEYWQKKPLLIRQAIPNFKNFLTPQELMDLATDEDAQARLITQKNGKWQVQNSPLEEPDFAKHLKLKNNLWTILVQNINHHMPQAVDLLQQFNFIPHARLDDLMISYAPKGSGIGAHIDSYDVFLLQGAGQRKWQLSNQKDFSLVENAPLKLLKNFTPEQEWVLEAGDMLYLPPHIAHCGTSMSDDCMTYSIGFRAPSYQELAHEFLSFLQDKLPENAGLQGRYTDPNLTVQENAGEISDAFATNIYEALSGITWKNDDIADFLGHYLSEPKAHVYFDAPIEISLAVFTKKLAKTLAENLSENLHEKKVQLSLKSQLLFTQNAFYLNGEKLTVPLEIMACMRELADKRCLNGTVLPPNSLAVLAEALYEPYLSGFIELT